VQSPSDGCLPAVKRLWRGRKRGKLPILHISSYFAQIAAESGFVSAESLHFCIFLAEKNAVFAWVGRHVVSRLRPTGQPECN
jgi:hypothetical protein